MQQGVNYSLDKTTKVKQKKKAISPKHLAIVQMYKSGKVTTEYIAALFKISPRQVQRLANKHGVIRSLAESNRLVAPLKNYRKIPDELKVKRKHMTNKKRYLIITNHPYCTVCGMRAEDGVRLEIDHIDEDATNNEPSNLQVLCTKCNQGKSHVARFGP